MHMAKGAVEGARGSSAHLDKVKTVIGGGGSAISSEHMLVLVNF